MGVTLAAMPLQEPFAGRPSPQPNGYVCYRASKAPELDGSLKDPAWQSAPWTEDFVDIAGDVKPKPKFRTHAKMLWDDRFLYVGAELEEPLVWATLKEHDSVIFQDNDFEIFIDPNGDNHLYGEIEVNAFGTEWDLLLAKPYKDGGPAINGWEIPGLKIATHVEGKINDPTHKHKGWSVEIAIPWKALGEIAGCDCPPKNGDQWRINFSRVEWQVRVEGKKVVKVPKTPEDNWIWSPQGVIDMHRPERWGYLQFSTAEPGKDVFRPDPDWPARELLHRVYYAQRAFRDKNGRFAKDVAELFGEGALENDLAKPPAIQTTDSGFEASWPPDEPRRLHIREDSRIWKD
jgi:hypothetical protein